MPRFYLKKNYSIQIRKMWCGFSSFSNLKREKKEQENETCSHINTTHVANIQMGQGLKETFNDLNYDIPLNIFNWNANFFCLTHSLPCRLFHLTCFYLYLRVCVCVCIQYTQVCKREMKYFAFRPEQIEMWLALFLFLFTLSAASLCWIHFFCDCSFFILVYYVISNLVLQESLSLFFLLFLFFQPDL